MFAKLERPNKGQYLLGGIKGKYNLNKKESLQILRHCTELEHYEQFEDNGKIGKNWKKLEKIGINWEKLEKPSKSSDITPPTT